MKSETPINDLIEAVENFKNAIFEEFKPLLDWMESKLSKGQKK